jgi:hypothetical protein
MDERAGRADQEKGQFRVPATPLTEAIKTIPLFSPGWSASKKGQFFTEEG